MVEVQPERSVLALARARKVSVRRVVVGESILNELISEMWLRYWGLW